MNDLASTTTSEQVDAPADGDASICIGCGEISIFDSKEPTGARRPTNAEYDEIVADPIIKAARGAWLEIKKELAK